MNKGILVTGLSTLHWGRLQYGNVGNYYIVEPMFRLLHKHFPKCTIYTTLQMDQTFVEKEKIEVLPMDLYYAWKETDIPNAQQDVAVARKILQQDVAESTPYIDALQKCFLVINLSGDMWGNNAEHVGKERFYVDCLKMQTAQMLGKKTILYAATPGPFDQTKREALAKEVFEAFDLVVIRERVSKDNLQKWGMDTRKVVYAPCPSFLFEANQNLLSKWGKLEDEIHANHEVLVGMTFGGFNMPKGPYDMWPREEAQYDCFLTVARYITAELKAKIILFSHTNGFDLPPHFRLKNGRDFDILHQFYHIFVNKYPDLAEQITLVDEPMLPYDLKGFIGKLDMLFTGRVHASVAATSQYVPTVFLEYDSRIIYSDKMKGFSEQLGLEQYVCRPENLDDMIEKTRNCFLHRQEIRERLKRVMPDIWQKADAIYELMKQI